MALFFLLFRGAFRSLHAFHQDEFNLTVDTTKLGRSLILDGLELVFRKSLGKGPFF